MDDRLRQIGKLQRQGKPVGIYAVCSAHPVVLETAFEQAASDGSDLLIESTCNQVNQYGGYAGMTPAGFVRHVGELADRNGFPQDRLRIGGDHLGPHVWRNAPAESAMADAVRLVSDCVAAGYAKIHLDSGMPLGDDPPGPLSMAVSAERSAILCRAAESARTAAQRDAGWPVYVIGAEAPTPGGSLAEPGAVTVTRPEEVSDFLEICKSRFLAFGLDDAWRRVVAVVVQPGIDFGDAGVAIYNRENAEPLSRFHDRLPGSLTYEIHGTDYQPPEALSRMVADHFALLKIGPVLTFAFREAVFALAHIESEWLGRKKNIRLSEIRTILEAQMREYPDFWKSHHSGDESDAAWRRSFSFLDRVRYYWARPAVENALDRLLSNLSPPIPSALIHQYLPEAYPAITRGALSASPLPLIRHRVRAAFSPYAEACRMRENGQFRPGALESASRPNY